MRTESFTDTALIGNLMNNIGVDAAIRYLYRENFELLSRYILNNSGNEQDAEDIFQESIITFVSLVQAGRFRGESSIRTFLFVLNKNIWLNELKRRGRATIREEKFGKQNEQNEQDINLAMEMRQSKSELMKAINELGENCKKILLLYYYENNSMKEIVSHLPYENEQVVRNKKSKCLKKLEEIISSNKNLYQQLKLFFHG